ncbi:MAG: pilus assembly PilX N-terminal domain-containing protein [Lachnospiraceae bacterium]|nr:pilus assembly PilX N-terminal domain-containing protein [Lachnospiraceae bacterium]
MKRNNYGHNNIASGKDRGSTLITVIVAIAFVTILVTIILGTTVVNVRMKGIDRRTKDDFYYAEKALNDIYTGIGLELANLAGEEYEKTFKKIGIEELSGDDFNMAETAERDFRKNFVKEAKKKIDGLDGGVGDNKISKGSLTAYITGSGFPTREVRNDVDIVYQKKDGSAATESDADRVVLKDVTIVATDSSGYESVISADIVINIPTLDFLGTNVDVSDYALIAGKGLYITGDSTVNGNVYAGVHMNPTPVPAVDAPFQEKNDDKTHKGLAGGINVKGAKATFNGNYIISKGDINLARVNGKDTKLTVLTPAAGGTANLANLWYTSLRTIKGENPDGTDEEFDIDINANVFALNDLVINADNTSVKIKGNYYGYNDNTLKSILGYSEDAFEEANKKNWREDAINSAIIINGSNASLDMKEINNLVLMGKAYIDFTSDTSTTAWENGQVVPTAESVALKTNQQLYLVPPDFLDGPNPVVGGSGVFNILSTDDLKKWFGYDFLDTAKIHEKYEVTAGDGSKIYYDYLVFNEASWEPVEMSSVSMLPEDTENEKYIVTKKNGSPVVIKYTKSGDELGTRGSISSKALFFLKIMTSEAAYEYAYSHGDPDASIGDPEKFKEYKESKADLQPCAYRLYKRIDRSMGWNYFNLSKCVVGDSDAPENAHYYAKNAVINYEKEGSDFQSNVLNNTDGMFRYISYPQSLYNRYKWLCTSLDGKEDMLLEDDPGEPKDNVGNNEWKVDTDAPFSKFVNVANIGSMTIDGSKSAAGTAGLKPTTFGVVVATNGNLTLGPTIGETFKGVAIVDGNITVPSSVKEVDGLLMATGTITLEGNTVNYDRGLIQSRIEKEINMVKNKETDTTDDYKGKKGYMEYYLISYLSKQDGTNLLYDITPGSKIRRDRVEADYNEFMHYENWQKGSKD